MNPNAYAKIGFVGEMASGKSYAAMHLNTWYGYNILSFAEPLREHVCDFLKKSDPYAGTQTDWKSYLRDRKHTRAVRNAYQFLGDDVARTIHGPDVWIKHFDLNYGGYIQSLHNYRVVVDDVRYPNEIQYLRERGFYLIRLNRDPLERENHLRMEILRCNPDIDEAGVLQLLQEWQCHPSEAQIRGLDIDEEIEYNHFSEWAEVNIGSIRKRR